MYNAIDLGEYYKIPSDSRDLNYGIYETLGMKKVKVAEYSSSNTKNLDLTEMISLLNKINIK